MWTVSFLFFFFSFYLRSFQRDRSTCFGCKFSIKAQIQPELSLCIHFGNRTKILIPLISKQTKFGKCKFNTIFFFLVNSFSFSSFSILFSCFFFCKFCRFIFLMAKTVINHLKQINDEKKKLYSHSNYRRLFEFFDFDYLIYTRVIKITNKRRKIKSSLHLNLIFVRPNNFSNFMRSFCNIPRCSVCASERERANATSTTRRKMSDRIRLIQHAN